MNDSLITSYTLVGESDFKKQKEVKQSFYKAVKSEALVDAKKVSVLVDTLPEGVVLSNNVLSVEKGYKHEILGKFSIDLDTSTIAMQIYWIVNYESDTAYALCNAQVPFKILTVGIWMLSPTYWPCFPKNKYTPEMAEDDVRRFAVAAGGDPALMQVVKTKTKKPEDDELVYRTSGYILKVDNRFKGKKIKTRPAS